MFGFSETSSLGAVELDTSGRFQESLKRHRLSRRTLNTRASVSHLMVRGWDENRPSLSTWTAGQALTPKPQGSDAS